MPKLLVRLQWLCSLQVRLLRFVVGLAEGALEVVIWLFLLLFGNGRTGSENRAGLEIQSATNEQSVTRTAQ